MIVSCLSITGDLMSGGVLRHVRYTGLCTIHDTTALYPANLSRTLLSLRDTPRDVLATCGGSEIHENTRLRWPQEVPTFFYFLLHNSTPAHTMISATHALAVWHTHGTRLQYCSLREVARVHRGTIRSTVL